MIFGLAAWVFLSATSGEVDYTNMKALCNNSLLGCVNDLVWPDGLRAPCHYLSAEAVAYILLILIVSAFTLLSGIAVVIVAICKAECCRYS